MRSEQVVEARRIVERCPRFARCSVAICPLDLFADCETRLPGEPKCTLAKSIRHRLGTGTELPRQGLTKQEWAARQRWEGLSESQRRNRLANLRPFGSIIHESDGAKQKGGW